MRKRCSPKSSTAPPTTKRKNAWPIRPFPPPPAKLLTLEAEALVRVGKPLDAEKLLREVLVLYPGQADPAQISLIFGIAKLSVPETSAEAAILQKTAGDQPETPVAKSAQYELALFALNQGVTPEKIAALSQWIAANPRHPQVLDAKKMLIFAYVTLSRQGGKPTAESKLGDADQKALTLAGEVLAATVRPIKRPSCCSRSSTCSKSIMPRNGANDAAIAGLETLLKSPLNREQRLQALRLAAASKNALAMKWLETQSRLGKLPAAAPLGQLAPGFEGSRFRFAGDRPGKSRRAGLADATQIGGRCSSPGENHPLARENRANARAGGSGDRSRLADRSGQYRSGCRSSSRGIC